MRNIVVLLAASTLLAACSTQKFNPGPEVTLTENYKNRTGRRGETINPETKWWANFGDKNLNALVDEALARNLSIEAARERVYAAKLTARIANSAYLPQIDAVASATTSGTRNKQPVVVGADPVTGETITRKRWVTNDTSNVSKGLNGVWVINPLAWKST